MQKLFTLILVVAVAVTLIIQGCRKSPDESTPSGIKPALANRPPVANAGNDTTIVLPANRVVLNGSLTTDPDHNITTYIWSKVSGPSSFKITNPDTALTTVTDLTVGEYIFVLIVTDSLGVVARDTINVFVNNPLCTNCQIVFVSDRDGDDEIYSCNADGSDIHRLTNDRGADEQPVWSPDGSRITFISDRSGHPELYVMNADGSHIVRKTFTGTYLRHPTWSPDGSEIAYSNVGYGIYRIGDVGTPNDPVLILSGHGLEDYPSWSSDGKKIAFESVLNEDEDVHDIFTINTDGTGFITLTGNINDADDYFLPSWSPDGTKLAVYIMHLVGNEFNSNIGVMNADGSTISTIATDAAQYSRTCWSRDGTRIIYTAQSGSSMNVSWVSPDGSSGGTIIANAWDADWKRKIIYSK